MSSKNISSFTCDDCKYIKSCSEKYGEYNENGDDYRAICGTHFCKRSWDQFLDTCSWNSRVYGNNIS